MSDTGRAHAQGCHRRSFLAACATGALAASDTSVGSEGAGAPLTAIDFAQSYLFCTPRETEIWVRPQIECRLEVFDRNSQRADEYVLSVVAKTGLTKDPKTGGLNPGYDYWIIFSRSHVYTRRTHTSSYFNNPTTLTLDKFGMADWRFSRRAARMLQTEMDVRDALQSWSPIVARSEFLSEDRGRGFTIEYPVKWADFNLNTNAFRVETGPVLLLDPETVAVGKPLEFIDFRWAHLDYHRFDHVRCLVDRPTSILTDATFTPPAEHNRQHRANAALTIPQVEQIERTLFDWSESPLDSAGMRSLFQTDHYSEAVELAVATTLYALEPNDSEGTR